MVQSSKGTREWGESRRNKAGEAAKFHTCGNSVVAHRTTFIQSHLKSHWEILNIKEIQCDKYFQRIILYSLEKRMWSSKSASTVYEYHSLRVKVGLDQEEAHKLWVRRLLKVELCWWMERKLVKKRRIKDDSRVFELISIYGIFHLRN